MADFTDLLQGKMKLQCNQYRKSMRGLLSIGCLLLFSFSFSLLEGVNNAGDASGLENGINTVNASGGTITITGSFPVAQDLTPLNTNNSFQRKNEVISIDGGGYTLTFDSVRGFFALGGNVTISNLVISQAIAQGGNGGGGAAPGGGGAGLGGGLFVGIGTLSTSNPTIVTLENVTFDSCEAKGGNAGGNNTHDKGAGGGGMQGAGGGRSEKDGQGCGGGGFYGNGFSTTSGSPYGGGGGCGSSANGGDATSGGTGGGNFMGNNQIDRGTQDPIPSGSGGPSGTSNQPNGLNAGYGGGGGGGYRDSKGNGGDGGNGGFGGGGGGGGGDAGKPGGIGGAGGFGGGGGGGTTISAGGKGGFGGGNGGGNGDGAGGGSGFGGAIFIDSGFIDIDSDNLVTATLYLSGLITFTGNAASGGNAVGNGSLGEGMGQDIFMRSGSSLIAKDLAGDLLIPSAIEGDQNEEIQAGGLTLESGNESRTVTLSGFNTYTGTTTISSGTLFIDSDVTIITDTLVKSGGILQIAGGNPLNSKTLTLSGGTLSVPSAVSSFSSKINFTSAGSVIDVATSFAFNAGVNLTGSGEWTKTGAGTLDLTNSSPSSYGATLNLEEGIVLVAKGSQLGKKVVFGNGTLQTSGSFTTSASIEFASGSPIIEVVGPTETVAFNGSLTGSEEWTKTGAGTLDLSGSSPSSYSAMLNLEEGTLRVGKTGDLGGGVTFSGGVVDRTLLVSETFSTSVPITLDVSGNIGVEISKNLIILGDIIGTSDLTKTNFGRLTLGKASPYSYSGDFTLSRGRVILENNTLFSPSSLTIEAEGILGGNGTLGDGGIVVTNRGAIRPGASIGTIVIDGDYVQDPIGRLRIEIQDDGQSDLLEINGTTDLSGALVWTARPGIYFLGDTFLFLQANGGFIDESFDEVIPFRDFFIDASVMQEGNALYLVILNNGPVPPVPNQELCGNPRQVADYLFCRKIPRNRDLIKVMRQIVYLPPQQYAETLSKLSPVQMWALPQTVAQNDTQIANFNYSRYLPCCQNERTYLWVAPLASSYHRDQWVSHCGEFERKRDLAFHVHSEGVSIGHLWAFNKVNCGVHGDYLFSSLKWSEDAGSAKLNAFYFAPFFDYFFRHCHLSSSLVLCRTLYDVDRHIHFGTIDRTAHNNHKSWNILARVALKGKYSLFSLQKGFFICPEGAVNYLNIWESSYRESGANSINLSVNSKHSAFFNPRGILKMTKEFLYVWGCISASFAAGWESFISLSDARYEHTSFFKQETCQDSFFVEGFNKNVHQAILGAELELDRTNHFGMTLRYEFGLSHHSYTHEGVASLIWKW